MKNFRSLIGIISFVLLLILIPQLTYGAGKKGKFVFVCDTYLYSADLYSDGVSNIKEICPVKLCTNFFSDYGRQDPRSLWGDFKISPDGKKIIFREDENLDIGYPGFRGDLWIMNTDGSGMKRLTYDMELKMPPDCHNFYWFSDSKRILYSSENINGRIGGVNIGSISILDIETGKKKILINKGSNPSLSLDNKKVFYSLRDEASNGQIAKIYCVDVNNKNNKYLGEIKDRNISRFQDWTKDGTMILLRGIVLDITDNNYYTYSDIDNNPNISRWLPDNKHIAYVRCDSANNIFITDINGSHTRQLTSSGDITKILSVTKEKIYYIRSGKKKSFLWSIGLNGSNPEKLLENIDYDEIYIQINK